MYPGYRNMFKVLLPVKKWAVSNGIYYCIFCIPYESKYWPVLSRLITSQNVVLAATYIEKYIKKINK